MHSIGPSQLGRDRGQRHGDAGGQHKNGPQDVPPERNAGEIGGGVTARHGGIQKSHAHDEELG